MADDPTPTPPADPPAPVSSGHDAAYWEREARKAFAERDAAREAAGTVSKSDREELERLRQLEAAAEEKRKLEAGEFEAAKKTLLDRVQAAEAKEQAARDQYARKVIETAFHGAGDLFGPSGLTTLTPDFAYAGLGGHVDYVPGASPSEDRIVVKDLAGEVIRGDDGQPAPFRAGMAQLIDVWPGKEQILRAGQKAGSGSTGGSGDAALPVDRAELIKRVEAGDPQALEQYRASRPTGRTVHGAFWDKQAAAAKAK